MIASAASFMVGWPLGDRDDGYGAAMPPAWRWRFTATAADQVEADRSLGFCRAASDERHSRQTSWGNTQASRA